MRVMIVVTHLLGTGHLARALVLTRAINDAGHHACVVSGGMPAPHLHTDDVPFIQLPPLQSDGVQFTRLLDAERQPVTLGFMEKRRTALSDALNQLAPNVLITELFPFGRRVLRDEFIAVLEASQKHRPRPCVVASVRDILAPPSKPEKAEATEALIDQYYDAVLVHSDPEITPLTASWPVTPALDAKLRYTGFVAPTEACPGPAAPDAASIVVSAGGGNVGAPLFETAIGAAKLDPELHWHLLVGGSEAAQLAQVLKKGAPDHVTIEPARPEFRQMLYHAKASVSLCGYNTALDVLQAGTPAVFVPFEDGGEIEQVLRARALSRLDAIELLPAAELTAARLLVAVRRAIVAPNRAPMRSNLCGAAETVRILETLVYGKDGAN